MHVLGTKYRVFQDPSVDFGHKFQTRYGMSKQGEIATVIGAVLEYLHVPGTLEAALPQYKGKGCHKKGGSTRVSRRSKQYSEYIFTLFLILETNYIYILFFQILLNDYKVENIIKY